MRLTIEEIEEILRREYDIDEDDEWSMECGCYINGTWLSIRNILSALEEKGRYL
jgi:hypothetical protein